MRAVEIVFERSEKRISGRGAASTIPRPEKFFEFLVAMVKSPMC
jgi:hypothetical protein